jgi:hypothetical protein
VSRHARVLTLVGMMTTGFSCALLAADEVPAEVPVTRDLTAVIALQGLPCGKVVSASQRGEDDYVASCADGNRYRVFVNVDGRVMVEKVD